MLMLLCLMLLTNCIENNIPYPYIPGQILAMEVEGIALDTDGNPILPVIDSENRTVTLTIFDDVNIDSLRITRLEITDDATLQVDSLACINYVKFPSYGFSSLADLPVSANTRMRMSKPTIFQIGQYSQFEWRVTVNQIPTRQVKLENQVGDPIIDEHNKQIVVYVSRNQDMRSIVIEKLEIGPANTIILPDYKTVTDFTRPQHFAVKRPYVSVYDDWTVTVLYAIEEESVKVVDTWATFVKVEAPVKDAEKPTAVISYRLKGEESWISVPQEAISNIKEDLLDAQIENLKPASTYECKVTSGGKDSGIKSFTTDQAQQVANSSFDDWIKMGKNFYATSELEFNKGLFWWDSGNAGANTIGEKNPTSPETVIVKKGQAAKLASTAVFGVFAAGNIYTGRFNKTIGTSGAELGFGRPFQARPSQLKGYYKYTPGSITHTKKDFIKIGQQDSCTLYVLLTDWSAPFIVNTAEDKFVNLSDPKIIAYGTLPNDAMSRTMSDYEEFNIDIQYRSLTRKPTHILIVGSASKYGDYFTGSTNSVLLLDELELKYNIPVVDPAYIK